MSDVITIIVPCGGCARLGDYTQDLQVASSFPRHLLIFSQSPLPGSLLTVGVYPLEISVSDPAGTTHVCEKILHVECAATFYNTEQTAECPEGQTGDSVTIPAGQYSSTVSQEDADAQALAAAQSQLLCCPQCCPVVKVVTLLSGGVAGRPYNNELTATGGAEPYTWISDDIPAWMTLATDGSISGTPTESGDLFFSATVTDANGETCTGTFKIVVADFAPPQATLIGWFKADDLSLPDGSVVNTFPDASGLLNNMTTFASVHYYNNILNGKPVFRFSFETVGLNFPNTDGIPTGWTILLVAKRASVNTQQNMPLAWISTAGNFGVIEAEVSGSNLIIKGIGTDTFVTVTEDKNDWHVISTTFDNTEKVPRIYGSSQTAAGIASSSGTTVNHFGMGGDNTDIAELLFYREKLSDTDLAQARNYLANKYGLTILV